MLSSSDPRTNIIQTSDRSVYAAATLDIATLGMLLSPQQRRRNLHAALGSAPQSGPLLTPKEIPSYSTRVNECWSNFFRKNSSLCYHSEGTLLEARRSHECREICVHIGTTNSDPRESRMFTTIFPVDTTATRRNASPSL
jgi:hypothetical protein